LNSFALVRFATPHPLFSDEDRNCMRIAMKADQERLA
jgi:hypothetical protein